MPRDVTVWSWIFESQTFPGQDDTRGFTNAVTGQHMTYTEIKRLTGHLSSALLRDCGLGEGDCLIVYSRNSVMYPAAILSAARVGIVACGVSPDYNADELAHALRTSRAKFIFAADDNWDVACQAADKVGLSRSSVVVLDGTPSPGRPSVQPLISRARDRGDSAQAAPYQIPRGKDNHQVCAYLGFSSGTTGLPKAVMISHANVIAQCLQVMQITPSDQDKMLAALPFYHITGIVHQLHLPIAINANVYILPAFTMDRLLQVVTKYKIRDLLLVPPILIRMVREAGLSAKYDLSHVRRFSSGAAPLPQEVLTLLQRQFPGTGFKQGYGMTESCSCIAAHPPSKYSYKYASRVGTIVASTEVRIVDPDTGRDCGLNQPGEIWARGPQVTMGYLDNPKATAETFDADGFLHTGDIGIIDDEGFISVTDRLKEMVKVKGIGVAPAELENLLLGHPAVRDCAVTGIPDDRAGERPKAFVVPKQPGDAAATAGQLMRFVRETKTRHKWLAEVEFLDEIPKSAAGKILRKKLRDPSRKVGKVYRDDTVAAKL